MNFALADIKMPVSFEELIFPVTELLRTAQKFALCFAATSCSNGQPPAVPCNKGQHAVIIAVVYRTRYNG